MAWVRKGGGLAGRTFHVMCVCVGGGVFHDINVGKCELLWDNMTYVDKDVNENYAIFLEVVEDLSRTEKYTNQTVF